MFSYVRKIWTQDVLFIFMINFLFKKIKHPVDITENYLIDINFMYYFTPNCLQCVTHNQNPIFHFIIKNTKNGIK